MKNKEILKNYLYWFLTFFGCMLVGIIRTYALTFTDFTDVHSNTTLYVGYASSGNPISWPYNNSTLYQSNIISLDYVVNTNITGGVHYEFESHMLRNFIINVPTYSVVDANGNTCLTDSYYLNFINGEYPRWDFQCPSNSSGFTIHIQQSNNSKLFNEGYMGWGSAILSKTDIPISSNGNDTEEIINNNNYNTNQIIDNQNENTDRIIEENNKNFNNCTTNVNFFNKNNYHLATGYTDGNGTLASLSSSNKGFWIKLLPNSTYTINVTKLNTSTSNSADKMFTFFDTEPISVGLSGTGRLYFNSSTSTINYTFTTDSTHIYMFSKLYTTNVTTPYTFEQVLESVSIVGPYCTNKIDDLNNNLTSDNVDDSSIANAFNDFNDYLDDNSTITQLLTLPITLFTAILNNVNGTCQPFNLGVLYGENLILPCIDVSQYLGSTLWSMIDIIISGFAIFAISKKMIKVFNNFSSLKEGDVIDD